MPDRLNPPAPEKAAPRVVAAFFTEFVANADKEYALLGEHSETSLFDFRMEVLIFGLHCLDRAVFACWGAEYRTALMNCAFSFAYDMFSGALPESQREIFLEEFRKHRETRQSEYGAMKLQPGEDGAMKNVLTYEFTKRICIDAGVYSPPVQIALTEWANGISVMMLKIAREL